MISYTGLSPGAGDLFFFGRLRRLLRGSETESNAKGTPSQGAFGAEGLGRLFVCMNPRAHEALFRDAERHAAPSEHGGLCRAVGRRRSVAGVEEVRSVGAVRPIGWEGSRSEREGTRVRGETETREGGAAGAAAREAAESSESFFFRMDKAGTQTHAEFLGFRAEVPQGPQNLSRGTLHSIFEVSVEHC